MNKVKLNVVVEKKVDNRVNNTGRPVNKKSSRQIRLAKQALYSKLNNAFVSGKEFKINNDSNTYVCVRMRRDCVPSTYVRGSWRVWGDPLLANDLSPSSVYMHIFTCA